MLQHPGSGYTPRFSWGKAHVIGELVHLRQHPSGGPRPSGQQERSSSDFACSLRQARQPHHRMSSFLAQHPRNGQHPDGLLSAERCSPRPSHLPSPSGFWFCESITRAVTHEEHPPSTRPSPPWQGWGGSPPHGRGRLKELRSNPLQGPKRAARHVGVASGARLGAEAVPGSPRFKGLDGGPKPGLGEKVQVR